MNESLISIVAPLEADTPAAVDAFVEETVAVLRGLVSHYEIILVDDGAPEATVHEVQALLGRYDFVRFLRLSRHFGEETAIGAGLDLAIGDYVIVMLPNMDPPALIPEFFEHARDHADIVFGVRLHRRTEPLWYRAGARLFYWYINKIVKAGIPEDSTQFRCMSRQVVNAIGQIHGPDQYLRLLTSYIGFRKQGLPYAPINRTGAPTVRPKREAVNLARALVLEHSTHPLRTVLWTGVLVAAVALVARGDVMFFVLAMMIAVVGEYVGGLSRRTRDRPAYYVREEHTSSVLLREERRNVVQSTSGDVPAGRVTAPSAPVPEAARPARSRG
jgi:dolichol-phosphate mannosyltransferase